MLDEAYERIHRYGPEWAGYLSNHAPMVVEVLDRYGCGSSSGGWLDSYVESLEDQPHAVAGADPADWRELLGDSSKLPEWLGMFAAEVRRGHWTEVLATWWPRLLPGSVASATHALIRTGHAVRALQRVETEPRVDELAQALAYWAARYQPLPGARAPRGALSPGEAIERLPRAPASPENLGTRVLDLAALSGWTEALEALRAPHQPGDVAGALDSLVDAAVTSYRFRGHGNPVMLVHAATAPAAFRAVLAVLPEDLWLPSYDTAWCLVAAVTSLYAPAEPDRHEVPSPPTAEEAIERALRNGDEHAIKFADAALGSHARGNETALAAAGRADLLLAR